MKVTSRISVWTKRVVLTCVIGILMVSIVIGGGALKEQYDRYQEVQTAKRCQETLFAPVVRLVCEYNTPYGKRKNKGSGVVVYSRPNQNGSGYDTYVLTANHVIETPTFSWKKMGNPKEGGEYYDLRPTGVRRAVTYVEYFHTATGRSIKVPAYVVAYSPNTVFGKDEDGNFEMQGQHWTGRVGGEDLALLKLETNERFCAANMLPPDVVENLRVLNRVRLVGCALGDKPIQTSGEISRIETGYMQVNASIIFGNSGGACFLDSDPHYFIGISNAVRSVSTPLGTTIPVSHMALVRPIKRIYRWLDSEKYAFIYDESVSDAERFERIQRDKYRRYYALQNAQKARIDSLQKEIRELKERDKTPKEQTTGRLKIGPLRGLIPLESGPWHHED